MKTIIITLLIFSLLSCTTPAKWTKTELIMEGTVLALHMVDWSQTLYIAKHPGEYHEHNPILGNHPSQSDVNLLMGVWLVVQPVVAHLLPSNWRKGWIAATGIAKLGAVINNASIGLGWGF